MTDLDLPKQCETILVVENDRDTRVSVARSLEDEGYFVFSAANGKIGLDLLNRIKPPCLILLDLMMPVMDGEAFLKTIAAEPDFQKIPVVIISAYPEKVKALKKSNELGKAAGSPIREFVQKPFGLNSLVQIVANCCVS